MKIQHGKIPGEARVVPPEAQEQLNQVKVPIGVRSISLF
jgi:hypothetical protein